MSNRLITEAFAEQQTKLKAFVGADDATENFYLLASPEAFESLRKTPLALAHGVMVTNEVEAAQMLQEREGISNLICYIASDDVLEGDLQPLKGYETFRESLADTGFCRLELTNATAQLYQLTATFDDLFETIIDIGHEYLGENAPIRAAAAREDGLLKVWKCISEAKTGTLVAVSFESQVIPFSILPPGATDFEIQEQILLAEEFGTQMDPDRFDAFRAEGRLPERVDFTIDNLVTEQVRPQMVSSLRLKRVVTDLLNRNKEYRGKVRDVSVRGNDLTIRIARRTYKLKVNRDSSGLVTGVEFVWPRHRKKEMEPLIKSVGEAFKDASFKQVLEEAASGNKPRLVMLDYTKLDGGRRTRLVEPYSYRYRASKNRTYFYGWNVEEGGIRSYITDRINGARRTDQAYKPRFLVEIGAAQRAAKKIKYPKQSDSPATVTQAVIKRAHERFDLKGGYGKIIRALGRSVSTPYQQKRERHEKRLAKIKKQLGINESVRSFVSKSPIENPRRVDVDSVHETAKDDIVAWMAENVPQLANDVTYAKDNLINLVDPPKVLVGKVKLSTLKGWRERTVSDIAVKKYKAMAEDGQKAPPILVANGRFLDGGHRAHAYHQAGIDLIDAVDVTEIVNLDWDRWLDGDESYKPFDEARSTIRSSHLYVEANMTHQSLWVDTSDGNVEETGSTHGFFAFENPRMFSIPKETVDLYNKSFEDEEYPMQDQEARRQMEEEQVDLITRRGPWVRVLVHTGSVNVQAKDLKLARKAISILQEDDYLPQVFERLIFDTEEERGTVTGKGNVEAWIKGQNRHRSKLAQFRESHFESRFPDVIPWTEMADWIRKNKLSDGFGRVSERDAKHMAAAGNRWVLKEVPLSSIKSKAEADPDYKHRTPNLPILLGMDGYIIDGVHRVAMARSRGDQTILAYVAED